jgi:hypothetical protein
MTIREVLSAMGRRWYAPLLILVAGTLLVMVFARDSGVYTTKTVVTFLLPSATSLSLHNGSSDTSIIAFARAVVAEVNNGKAPAGYSSDDGPYYGAGIRQGMLIDVPNDGNQWYASYTRAEIDVQIVGHTEQWVAQRQSEIVGRIVTSAHRLQQALVENPKTYINVSVVPLTLNIEKVAPTRSAQFGAIAAMILAVLIVSAWSSVALDRRLRRRQPRAMGIPRFSRLKVKDSAT